MSSLRYCSHKGFNKKTPLLPGTDGRSGVFDIRGISADDNQPVAGNILTNKTVEREGLAASIIEKLVDERQTVVGSHICPAKPTPHGFPMGWQSYFYARRGIR